VHVYESAHVLSLAFPYETAHALSLVMKPSTSSNQLYGPTRNFHVFKSAIQPHMKLPRLRICSTSMTVSTENATPPKSTKSNNSNPQHKFKLYQDSNANYSKIPILKSRFEFDPRDTEESGFLDLVGFGEVVSSVETS